MPDEAPRALKRVCRGTQYKKGDLAFNGFVVGHMCFIYHSLAEVHDIISHGTTSYLSFLSSLFGHLYSLTESYTVKAIDLY